MLASIASRLQSARERLHLTQPQVQERTGIGISSLSEFENGHRQPSLSQLQALALLYERSLSWLLGEGGQHEQVVLWRERPESAKAAAVGARFLRLCEQYRNLEVWCDESLDCDLPPAPTKDPDHFSSRDAARLAKRVRDELALGDRPGESLPRTLEEACGVKVFHLSFEPTGRAASARCDDFGAGVLLNKGNVPWRRTFDIAHELFHLITWDTFRPGWRGEPLVATEQEEKLANVFAGNLLMPEEPFRLAVQRRMDEPDPGRLDQVYAVARQFAVSVDAALSRMGFLFDCDREDTNKARTTWRELANWYEDRGRNDPDERPRRFRALALTALRQGEVSIGRFAEYMGISRQKAMQIVRSQEEHGGKGATASPT